MKVVLSEDYGFCFGVKAAIDKVEELLSQGYDVLTDGDIVHNKRVMQRLRDRGLKVEDVADDRKEGVFAIRAHGMDPERIKRISQVFEKVVDLTCPIVKSLFEKARRCRDEGYEVVVFGKDGHAEMRALKGHVPDAVVTLEPVKLEKDRVCILSQTTSSWKEFSEFIDGLMQVNFATKEFLVVNTICPVTYGREEETDRLSRSCDLIVVVGGKHSANTGKLYRIASRNTRAVWIESPEEIDDVKLEGAKCVAVVSGTSTPKEDVVAVYEKLLRRG